MEKSSAEYYQGWIYTGFATQKGVEYPMFAMKPSQDLYTKEKY